MKKMLYLTWVVGALLGSLSSTFAQSNRHWDFAPNGFNIPQGQLMQAQLPKEYKLARLNVPALYQELSDAYRAPADAPPLLISIPNPEGGYSDFYISPTSVVADEVAHLYTVRTFKGYAKNSRQVTLRCDISPTGFHAAVFSGDVTYVIESASRSDVNAHIVYYKSDLEVPGFRCGVDDTHRRSGYKPSESGSPKTPANLRTYRLAIIADATFRAQFGGMPYMATNVLNSFASGMNMVNEVYERDLGVHLTVVSNTTCADAVLTDHTDIDAVHAFIVNSSGLGSGGFDVGHSLLWLDTGGVAYLGVVCLNAYKGGGFSGANGSVTQLYVDYMAHELGHQFGAEHTFASQECATSANNFRFEPGAGSTIMAYAGLCGAQSNYQNSSDPYFHAASIAQINTYISSGGTCAVTSTPGTGNNAAPTANAQSDITIPKQTPFILVGTGSDANADPVSYSWEQFNGAGDAMTESPNCTSTTQPLFRFRPPVADNYRVFPQMSDVLAGTNNTPAWEKLPCVARTLNFRLTARDNNTNWGRTASDNMVVTVADTGPFNVTAPNGGESWALSSTQNVTWSVNGTDAHCANVDVLISTDNGVTYSVLGTFPNNGSASVTMPGTASATARVLVQCSVGGNFRSASTFFDVSNAVFTIIEEGCGNAYWNMTAAAAASNTVDNTSVGNITHGNSNGAITLLSATSTSSGYTGVSGGNNAAVAARTGALNTAANGSAYFEVVVTPNANTIFTLNGISFGSRSTSTGPKAYSIRTSLDNYASQAAGSTLPNNSSWALYSVTGLSVASATGTPLTIRIYGHSGTGSPTAGQANWRIDDLTLTGCNDPVVVCPTLTTPGEVQITDSTCGTGCTVSVGQIQAPTMGCPTGSSIQYNVNGGGWSATLPTYAAGLTIQTRCLCDTDANTFSPASTGVTTAPGTCTVPAAPTGALAISNSTCSACAVSGGSIAIGTVSGTGGTLEYSTDGGQNWSATLPTYNQTGPAQTIIASVVDGAGCRSNTTEVGATVPGTCAAAPTAAVISGTGFFCIEGNTGNAPVTVTITGGTGPFTLEINDGGINFIVNNYNSGSNISRAVYGTSTYTLVSVTDANGCEVPSGSLSGSATMTQSPDDIVITGMVVQPSCEMPNGGSISITVTGGIAPFTFQWSNNEATEDLSDLSAGDYDVVVTDAGGCFTLETFKLDPPTGCCPVLGSAPGEVQITDSACGTGCTVSVGQIQAPTMGCPTGSSIQYNVNNGGWTTNLPTYAAGLTIQTRCLCDTDANTVSPASTGATTAPGTCITPDMPTLTITDNVCPSTPGSISAAGCGAGTVLEYASNSLGPWSTTAPAYTASSFTVYARCRNTTTDCVSSSASQATAPTVCATCPTFSGAPDNVGIVNGTCDPNCLPAGGSISAPSGTPCPMGSTLQYQVNSDPWSTTLPVYDQNGPAQTIKTRCSCNSDANNISAESIPVTTAPSDCTDNTPPTIICPSDITQNNDSGQCGAVVTFDNPSISDNCMLVLSPVTETFDFTGSVQNWVVPPGVTSITVDVYGGDGHGPQGLGGRVQATHPVTPGETLYLYVGGAGTETTGGFNGGGSGGANPNYGGGGGASDIRLGGTTLSDRIIVAGGGGGTGSNCGTNTAEGGHGGDLIGGSGCDFSCSSCEYTGAGGTQTAGGIAGPTGHSSCGGNQNGDFGIGGSNTGSYGTGGGGGYYGGGSGCFEGAGGGSSYTSNLATNVMHTQGVRSGNGLITITYGSQALILSEGLSSGSVFPVGTTQNTFTVSDDSGNMASCSFDVTVIDAANPTITCPATQTLTLDANCSATLPDYTSLATTGDNCGVQGVTQSPAAGTSVSGAGNTMVTLTATDVNGNPASCTFMVTLVDGTAPQAICKNINADLDADGLVTITPGDVFESGSDNCGTVTLVNVAPNMFDCNDIGIQTVALTVNDGNGNTATCIAEVNVRDVTPPVFECQNITVSLNAGGVFSIPSANYVRDNIQTNFEDNCAGISLTFGITTDSWDCDDIGPNTTTIFARDGNGNETSCTVTVTVTDPLMVCNQPPVAVCQPVTVNADANCEATMVTAEDFDGGSTDADMDPLTFSVSPAGPYALGTTNVILTVSDGVLMSQCATTVTVVDNTPPSIICPATQTLALDANCSASLPDYTSLATTGDNCGVQGVTQSPAAGTIVSGAGNMMVTLTVTDVNNLTNTCTFTVTKMDNIAPTVQCINQTVYFNGEESIALNANDLANASDNCGVQGISLSPNTISATQVGQTVPVTVTATDINGNVATCTAQITVSGFPAGWSQQSGGAGCAGNNNAYNPANGVWTVTSSNCFYGPPYTSDATSFVQRTLCGDGSITAQVTSISGSALGWAGIVMRESNAPGAKKAQLMTNLSNLSRREFRTAANAAAQPQQFPSQNRYWLRIVRAGNQFTMSVSANGTSWFLIGAQNIVMSNCIQMGLVATNYTANSTVTATFSNVSFTGSNGILALPGGGVAELAPQLSSLEVDFNVFPNPTNGELNLDLTQYAGKPVRIELYSLEGKLMKFVEIDEVQTIMEKFDLAAFQNGMYLVKVKSEGLPDATRRVVLTR